MKTFYVTGSTAGLRADEITSKFKSISFQISKLGAAEVADVSDINITSPTAFKDCIDLRLAMVKSVDCVVFTDDWKDTIESQLEFKEAGRLKKEIRMHSSSDMKDIERCLSGVVPCFHG